MVLNIILFSLVLSLDAYGAGIVFGLRKIKIRFASRVLIAAVTFIITACGAIFGRLVFNCVPPSTGKLISSAMIFLLGICILFEGKKKSNTGYDSKTDILSSPEKSDSDNSHSIEPMEAVYLAAAISADSFFTAAALNFNARSAFLLPVILTASQSAAIIVGQLCGKNIHDLFDFDSKKWVRLSGVIIMVSAFLLLL